MTPIERHLPLVRLRPARLGAFAALTASLLLGACSASTHLLPSIAMKPDDTTTGATTSSATPSSPQDELQRATIYWGQEYAKKPTDLKTALNYAKDLKAMGEKEKALSILQQASLIHGNDQELAGEYGRLALELEQVGVANQMLAMADDPTKPDWRVVSARGTVFAKQGKYTEAIPFYDRALTLAPNNPTVMNNLAMAYAMTGDAKKAEQILRQALVAPGATPKIRENLALVLGLQGRYDESKAVAAAVLNSDTASANAAYLKQMVRLEPTTEMPDSQSFADNTSVSPQAPAEPPIAMPNAQSFADNTTVNPSASAPTPVLNAAASASPLPLAQGVWQTSTDEALPVTH